jgi:hypothetical protein
MMNKMTLMLMIEMLYEAEGPQVVCTNDVFDIFGDCTFEMRTLVHQGRANVRIKLTICKPSIPAFNVMSFIP